MESGGPTDHTRLRYKALVNDTRLCSWYNALCGVEKMFQNQSTSPERGFALEVCIPFRTLRHHGLIFGVESGLQSSSMDEYMLPGRSRRESDNLIIHITLFHLVLYSHLCRSHHEVLSLRSVGTSPCLRSLHPPSGWCILHTPQREDSELRLHRRPQQSQQKELGWRLQSQCRP